LRLLIIVQFVVVVVARVSRRRCIAVVFADRRPATYAAVRLTAHASFHELLVVYFLFIIIG
jgi:hypothetical protein